MAVGADPRIGSELAGYRIESLLGRGGMSVVYLATQTALKRQVALKLLAPELSEDERFRERFLRESELAASLDHPNVIPIYDAGEAEGQLYIAMRYVEGTDLRELLKSEEKLEPARALSIGTRVADALDAAHKRGLVHRDVKPGNILIAEEGHVYLSDFGLTKQQASESGVTETGQFIGTADYVAPEQIERKPVSGQTDQYSLACVLYESLTGEAPFHSDRLMGVLWGHLNEPATPLSELNPELPAEIDVVLATGMAKTPEDRYPSCAELTDEAGAALGLSGEFAGPIPAATKRRRLLLAAGLVLLLTTIAAAVSIIVLTGGEEAAVGDEWTKVPHVESVFGSTQGVRADGVTASDDGLLVAVGTDGREQEGTSDVVLWTSRDGVTWTRVLDDDLGGSGWQSAGPVTAGPFGFVAVGTEGLGELENNPDLFDAAVWRSPDGQGWERIPHDEEIFGGPDDQSMFDVTVGGPGLVAVGHDIGSAQAAVWTSPDGDSWSRVQPDPQIFGSGTGTGIGRSETGEAQEVVIALGVATAEDGRIVAVGTDWGFGVPPIGVAWVSTDGMSWIRAVHNDAAFGNRTPTPVELWDVTAGGPGFVAVGVQADGFGGLLYDVLQLPGPNERAVVLTSEDGLSWSRIPVEELPHGGESVRLNAVTTGGPGLVAVGWWHEQPGVVDADIDPVVWTSEDGVTWTEAADPDGALSQLGGQLIADVTQGGPGLVAIGQDGSSAGFNAAVWTSP